MILSDDLIKEIEKRENVKVIQMFENTNTKYGASINIVKHNTHNRLIVLEVEDNGKKG